MPAAPAASAVTIRRAARGDEVALSLVGQASFLESFAGTLDGGAIVAHCLKQHSVEKYAGYLVDPRSAVWLAEAQPGGAPAGYVVLTTPDLPLADTSESDTEIKRIYLLHRFQGGGLGIRLMDQAHTHARATGKRRALLGVYGKNAAAIAFYERLGYRRVGERRFNVGGNFYDDLVMALNL